MSVLTPIEADWRQAGQAIIVLDDPDMVKRGHAGREGVIERLCGADLPGMAMVALDAEPKADAPLYVILPLAALASVRRTRLPDRAD